MKIDKLFGGFDISSKGLSAQRKRMNAIASNVANAETTKTEEGTPYRRKIVLLTSRAQQSFANVMQRSGLSMATTAAGHFGGGDFDTTQTGGVAGSVSAQETEDMSAFKNVYDPSHPDADEHGYVKMPNVNVVTEMVDMISASRSYEANVTAVNAAKTMAKDTLEI
jgi:flagellar basal-body rod protein FlgC